MPCCHCRCTQLSAEKPTKCTLCKSRLQHCQTPQRQPPSISAGQLLTGYMAIPRQCSMRMYSTLIHLLGMISVLGFLAGASFPLSVSADPVRPLHVALPDPGHPLNAVSSSLPLPHSKAARPLLRGLDPAPILPLPIERRKPSSNTIYTYKVFPPVGFHFCNPEATIPLNLYRYGAFFPVLYCTSEGDPAGTVAIWSYVAPDLCNTTFFESLLAFGTALQHDITIVYNGVGTVTTQSQAVPIVSNKYTIAGPNWLTYHDGEGDLVYAYSGTDPSSGPYTFSGASYLTICGSPFAIVVNNQFGTVTAPLCDHAGSVKGWILKGLGERQDQCIGKGVSDAQAYAKADLDADGRPMTTAKLVVYSFSGSAQPTTDPWI